MKSKNLILTLLILISFASVGYAQNANFKFGIKGGANLSTLKGDEVYDPQDPTVRIGSNDARLTGFVAGAFVRFGSNLFIQPELLLSQKGGTFNVYRDGIGSDEKKVDVRFTNLDVPVLVGIRIGEVLRINGGPVASLRLSENGGLRESLNEIGATSVKDNYKRAAIGYQLGVGFDIGNLSLDLRYEGNATNTVDVKNNNASLNSELQRKSNLWQATIGFVIF